MSDRIVLRSPGDVVAAVPALIGFHPSDSLVILYLSSENDTLMCTLRLDLDTPLVEVHRVLHDVAAQGGDGRLLLVAYPSSLAEWIDSANEDRLLDLDSDLKDAGIHVSDALIVTEGRWWSMLCTDPGCCPVGGRPIPDQVTELEAVTVHQGAYGVAESRDAVLSRFGLRPDLAPSDEVLETASDGIPSVLVDRCERVLTVLADLSAEPTTGDRAELGWLFQDVNVRDWALAHICGQDLDPAGVEALIQTALAAPDGLRPRLAGAAAAALYAIGGTTVGVRALIDHADGDSLAQLVSMSLDLCQPPSVLAEVFAAAMPELEQRIAAAS